MSLSALTHVWKHSKAKGSALLVMLALADYADDEGQSYPSVKTLSIKTRMSPRNVQKVIQKLITTGELCVVTGRGIPTANGSTNLYKLTPRTSQSLLKNDRGERGDRGEKHDIDGVNASSSDPSVIQPSESIPIAAIAAQVPKEEQPSLLAIPETPKAKTPKQVRQKKERARDPLFDAIAVLIFGATTDEVIRLNGGRIGKAKQGFLAGKPDATAEDVKLWRQWYHRTFPGTTLPMDQAKIAKHVGDWQAKQAPLQVITPVIPSEDNFAIRAMRILEAANGKHD